MTRPIVTPLRMTITSLHRWLIVNVGWGHGWTRFYTSGHRRLDDIYNHRRPHTAHGGETPVGVYRGRLSASGPCSRPDLHPTALVA